MREERGGWNKRQGGHYYQTYLISSPTNSISYQRGGTRQDFHNLLTLLSFLRSLSSTKILLLQLWTIAKERKHQSAHQKADDRVCRAVMSYVLSPWKPKLNPDYPHWENSQAFSISHSLFYLLHWACALPQRKKERASSVPCHYGVCMYLCMCVVYENAFNLFLNGSIKMTLPFM